jgi:rhodanese-related sulfurtransferase
VVTEIDTDEARRLLEEGAQLVDVLPRNTYLEEHLPDAISLPLAEIEAAPARLDPAKPVIVYCYDYQCDLSPRAAARLEQLGFVEVYDYVASKVAWLAEGLPGAGRLRDIDRAGSRVRRGVPMVPAGARVADVQAAIAEWELAVVVDDHNVVLGVVRAEVCEMPGDTELGAVMQAGPATVRPSIPIRELAASMDEHGEPRVLVTTLSGRLLGLVRREDLDGA